MLYYAPVQNLIEIPNKKDKSIKKTKSAENGSFEILKKSQSVPLTICIFPQ